mgnify:FL=1|jgi:hypothetical protein|tara:strand:- start:546 stop:779 length:234 start_codon:yes stop_codon:yes gene_type:complete
MDWLSWSNGAYLMVIILGAVGTMAAVKYKPLIKEIKEVFKKYNEAMADGKITKKEQQALAKECMDVLMSLVKLIWKF